MSNKLLGRFSNSDFAKSVAMGQSSNYGDIDVPGFNVIFQRFVVIDVIPDTSLFFEGNDEDFERKKAYWASLNVSNIGLSRVLPRNTIIGKRIFDGNASSLELPMFLFPFFASHLALPCKPGEHVWVMFETFQTQEMGYWMSKIVEVNHVDDVNHTHPPRAYEQSFFPDTPEKGNNIPLYEFRVGQSRRTNQGTTTSIDTSIIDTSDETFYEKLLTESDASKLITYEAVPRFKKRPGDVVLEGSNNALIVLGTDRTGPVAESEKRESDNTKIPKKPTLDIEQNSGCIDIVAGRGQTEKTGGVAVSSKSIIDGSDFKKEIGKSESEIVKNEGDPDWKNDISRVLVAQKTHVDLNLGLKDFNASLGIEEDEKGDGAVILKSDKIRLIARKDIEILIEGSNGPAAIVINSNGDIILKPSGTGVVKLGGEDANLAVLCNTGINAGGSVTSTPIVDQFGGTHGSGGVQGQWATKVLMK